MENEIRSARILRCHDAASRRSKPSLELSSPSVVQVSSEFDFMKFKQFAALPFRVREDDVEILLITTRKKGRWSVPKGWPIKNCTPQGTAAVEAFEEAGVRGAVAEKHIGRFRKRRLKKQRSVLCDVRIFPLKVDGQQSIWPEMEQRSRIWVSQRKAARLVKKAGLRRAIREFAAYA
jgi:8-oxo-dGTP pyrophosphatase MutT (NUDIX family)